MIAGRSTMPQLGPRAYTDSCSMRSERYFLPLRSNSTTEPQMTLQPLQAS